MATRRDTGIVLVLAFKLGKAVLWLALAALLGLLISTGRLEAFRDIAIELRTHVASRWSLLLGRALLLAANLAVVVYLARWLWRRRLPSPASW